MGERRKSTDVPAEAIPHRAEQLDALDAVLPFDRRDQLAILLTDEDVATLKHLASEGMGENTLRALTPQSVNLILKRRCQQAGLDPALFSAHGLRSGYLTEAANRGIPLPEAMQQSLHKSVTQAARYYDAAERKQGDLTGPLRATISTRAWGRTRLPRPAASWASSASGSSPTRPKPMGDGSSRSRPQPPRPAGSPACGSTG